MTKIITFCGIPNSGKNKLATEIAISLNKNYSMIFENKIMSKGESIESKPQIQIERDTFESQYRDILAYLLADIRNRSIARKNKMDFIIYCYSVYDLASFVEIDKSLSAGQKTYLTDLLFGHGMFFPSDVMVYCELSEKGKKLFKNGEEMKYLKQDHILMEILGSNGIDFWVAEKDDEIRSKNLLSKLAFEFDLKTVKKEANLLKD